MVHNFGGWIFMSKDQYRQNVSLKIPNFFSNRQKVLLVHKFNSNSWFFYSNNSIIQFNNFTIKPINYFVVGWNV